MYIPRDFVGKAPQFSLFGSLFLFSYLVSYEYLIVPSTLGTLFCATTSRRLDDVFALLPFLGEYWD